MSKSRSKKSLFKNVSYIVEPEFESINDSTEGLSPVRLNGKWGYINYDGEIVIEPQFNYVLEFSEGLACVNINNKWGYINHAGIIVIEPQYDDLPGSFQEGLARIAEYDRPIDSFKKGQSIRLRSKFGYINRKGVITIAPQYRHAGYFTEGLASVSPDHKCGYIDKQGAVIIDFIFDNAHPFINNRAVVCIDNKWGIIEHPLYSSL